MSRIRRITDRQEWLSWRLANINASDVPCLANVDRFRSALAVYAEKAGWIAGPDETPIMRRGRWLEFAAMVALREQHPEWSIEPAGVYIDDPELKIGCSPDVFGTIGRDLLNVQVKTVSKPVFDRDWSDGPPLGVVLQTLTEGMLLEAPHNMVAALVIDTYSAELELFPVDRHEGAERRIRELVADFWENLRNGVRPLPDYGRDADTIDVIHRADKQAAAIDFTGDNRLAELLPERALLKATQKALGEREKTIDAEIKDKLGSAEHAFLPGWKLSWKEEARSAYTVEASTRRVLRVSPIKEERAT